MKIAKQEQEISSLKQKLLLAKNATPEQNQNRSKSLKGYSFVEPRIDTGLPYKQGQLFQDLSLGKGLVTLGWSIICSGSE